MFDFLYAPFVDYAFMRRALAACWILSLAGAPLGVFMTLRRMTLVGDAMSHAILPGVALAFVAFGLSLWPLTLGGLLAGALVALLATGLARFTDIKEDSSFTLTYLLSLAGGVVLISAFGSPLDLLHLLFGSILAIDNATLHLIAGVACLSLLVTAFFFRSFVMRCFDPASFCHAFGARSLSEIVFALLLVLNLIVAFQALGTLMALGLLILPAIAARFWAGSLDGQIGVSFLFAALGSPLGLLISYHSETPAGPAIVLVLGLLALFSALCGRRGSLLKNSQS